MNILIRDAQPDDAAGIVAMWNPIILSRRFSAFLTPFTEADERAFIRTFPARSSAPSPRAASSMWRSGLGRGRSLASKA